jgi:hypothetical protein
MSFEKATIAGLVAFINRQPATREMDHSTWCGCAVGHFAVEELNVATDPEGYWAWDVAQQLYCEAGTNQFEISDCFRSHGITVRWNMRQSIMDVLDDKKLHNGATYGQLRTIMAERFPNLGFGQKPPTVLGKPTWFTEWSEKKFAELVAG